MQPMQPYLPQFNAAVSPQGGQPTGGAGGALATQAADAAGARAAFAAFQQHQHSPQVSMGSWTGGTYNPPDRAFACVAVTALCRARPPARPPAR